MAAVANDNVERLAVANGPNIFQMLLVLLFLTINFVTAAIFVYTILTVAGGW